MGKIALSTLIHDMSSEKYHSVQGTFSSSQLKDAVDDIGEFHKKYITKEIPRKDSSAFGSGRLYHTGILEPHLLTKEFVKYPGATRRGEAFEAFKKKHPGREPLTKKQYEEGELLVKVTKKSKIAMDYVSMGKPEVTLFIKIAVFEDCIVAVKQNLVMTIEGWIPFKGTIPEDAIHLILKVRADNYGVDNIYKKGTTFIQDLKSTSDNANVVEEVQKVIKFYGYELSAAFYLDMFSAYQIGKGQKVIERFIWTFASKTAHNCRSYEISREGIMMGRDSWMTAVFNIAEAMRENWTFPEKLTVIRPDEFRLRGFYKKTAQSI